VSSIPPPGHAIPYAYSPAEVQTFLSQYSTDPVISNYLFTKQPPYGVIFNESYGQILVWFDASGILHVIDVTNLSIAQQVQLPEYSSPDSSLIDSTVQSVENFVNSLQSGLSSGLLIAVVVGAGVLLYKVSK
jgi:hypothetical protein